MSISKEQSEVFAELCDEMDILAKSIFKYAQEIGMIQDSYAYFSDWRHEEGLNGISIHYSEYQGCNEYKYDEIFIPFDYLHEYKNYLIKQHENKRIN